jgi:hypothetical protein
MSKRRTPKTVHGTSDRGTMVVEIVVAVAALLVLMTSAVQVVRALDRSRARIEPGAEHNTKRGEWEQNDETAVIERLFE